MMSKNIKDEANMHPIWARMFELMQDGQDEMSALVFASCAGFCDLREENSLRATVTIGSRYFKSHISLMPVVWMSMCCIMQKHKNKRRTWNL